MGVTWNKGQLVITGATHNKFQGVKPEYVASFHSCVLLLLF